MADNRIIAVINQKGGTGKTTLALNLAAGLARRGSTHLVDADPQRSITQWVGMGGGAVRVCRPSPNWAATRLPFSPSWRATTVMWWWIVRLRYKVT